jgi:hypothetical protein
MSTVKSRIEALATAFANDVVRAIRSASLDELLGGVGGERRGPGRPRGSVVQTSQPAKAKSAGRVRGGGQLPRRSAEDIAKALSQIVSLLKSKKDGLRSEQIRAALKLRPNEMPRVLKEGIAKKQLKSRGQKRATTYFAT